MRYARMGAAAALLALALAGCAPLGDRVTGGEHNPDTGLETEATVEQTLADKIAGLTGVEADYEGYLNQTPTVITLLKESGGMKVVDRTIAVYPSPNEDSTALYVYSKNDEVTAAKLDEFSGTIGQDNLDADYIFYQYAGMLVKQPSDQSLEFDKDHQEEFEEDLRSEVMGEELYKLHEKLGVYVPVYRYEVIGSQLKLDTYTMVSEVGYTASTDVNVIYGPDGKILALYLDDSYGPGKQDPIGLLDGFEK